MSGLPVATTTVPSSLTLTVALELAAAVEPETGGDAAALVLAQRLLVIGVAHQRLDGLGIAVMAELRPIDHLGALARGVLQPQLERIDAELLREDVEHALHRERRDRRARRPVGRNLRPVADHVVADGARVRDVVGRQPAHAGVHHRRARERAGLVLEHAVGGGDPPVALHPDFHRHRRARRRSRGLEALLAAHHHLHRATGLARQHGGDRLDIDHGLAAEGAADLRRIDPQVAQTHAQQLRGIGAHHEVALARAPQLALAVGVEARDAGLRLDIGLVHRRGLERHLDDLVGLREARVDVADLVLDALGDVRRLARRRVDAARDHVLEQERRVRRHRLVDVDHVRQHLVVDLDQRERLVRDRSAGGGHGGDRMALVEHLLARHDVARHVPEVLRHPLGPDIGEGLLREVGRGHHRLHAGERLRLLDVDRADAGMRVRRAQDAADQHARPHHVGAVERLARHLRHAVRPDRPRAHPFELLAVLGGGRCLFLGRDILHGRLSSHDCACLTVARLRGKCKRSGTGAALATSLAIRTVCSLPRIARRRRA